jgi:acrosin
MLNISKSSHQPLRQCLRGITLAASTLVSCLVVVAGTPPAWASVPLTRADIEAILNRVELIPSGRSARVARPRDVMTVGDTLRTAAQSQAQLRFNDGSLARVGQRATFRFVPNTRNFRLSDGTMLLLIPPGRGRSTIQTPSAITGIQGSAIVVRHVKSRNLTVVMALTNNPAGPMTVTSTGCGNPEALSTDPEELDTELSKQTKSASEESDFQSSDDSTAECLTEYSLQAGQMALIQENRVQILEFDLPTFYETSPLIEGLELDNPDAESSLGPALDQVRAETLEALSRESVFSDATVLNPAVVGLDEEGSALASQPWLLSPIAVGPGSPERIRIFPPAGTLVNAPTNRPPTSAPESEPIDRTPTPEPEPIDRTPAPEPEPIDRTPAPEPEPIDRTPAPEPEPNPPLEPIETPAPEPTPEPGPPVETPAPEPTPEPGPPVETPAPEPTPEPGPPVETPAPEPTPEPGPPVEPIETPPINDPNLPVDPPVDPFEPPTK